jgi:hypothetical protein
MKHFPVSQYLGIGSDTTRDVARRGETLHTFPNIPISFSFFSGETVRHLLESIPMVSRSTQFQPAIGN